MGGMVVPRSFSSSSCAVLLGFDLIFMSPRHKTALNTKSGIKLGCSSSQESS